MTQRTQPENAEPLSDDKLAGWARNWHWNDCEADRPVDPSVYFRDMRLLKAFIAEFFAASPAPSGVREALERIRDFPYIGEKAAQQMALIAGAALAATSPDGREVPAK